MSDSILPEIVYDSTMDEEGHYRELAELRDRLEEILQGSSSEIPALLGQYIRLSEVQATGANGGDAAATTWHTRTLNVKEADVKNYCSLNNANQFVLKPGVYYMKASAPSQRTEQHRLRLYNASIGQIVQLGPNERCNTATPIQTRAFLNCEIVVESETIFELQHYTTILATNTGLGVAMANGDDEIYTVIELWRKGN